MLEKIRARVLRRPTSRKCWARVFFGEYAEQLKSRPHEVAGSTSQRSSGKLPWLVAAAAMVGFGVVSALYFRLRRQPPPKIRLEMVVPATDERSSFALSPDGRRVAFAASDNSVRRLWVRALDSTSAQPVPGTEGAMSPFWSPDGDQLGFFADFKLKRIDLGGAQPQVLAAVPSSFRTRHMGRRRSDPVLMGSHAGVPRAFFRRPTTAATDLATGPTNNQFTPRFLPGGRQFLYVVNGVDPAIWVGSLDGANRAGSLPSQ